MRCDCRISTTTTLRLARDTAQTHLVPVNEPASSTPSSPASETASRLECRRSSSPSTPRASSRTSCAAPTPLTSNFGPVVRSRARVDKRERPLILLVHVSERCRLGSSVCLSSLSSGTAVGVSSGRSVEVGGVVPVGDSGDLVRLGVRGVGNATCQVESFASTRIAV